MFKQFILQLSTQIRRYAFSRKMVFIWFFGIITLLQIVFNYFVLAFPINLLISFGLLFFYFILLIINFRNIILLEKSAIERNQIQSMMLSIDNPIISYSKDFEIILVNEQFEKLVGVQKEQIIGKIITPELVNDSRYRFIAQLIFPTLAPVILEKSTNNFPQKIKLQFNQPKELILEVITTKIIDEKGLNFGFLKIIDDLTHKEVIKKIQSDFIMITAHQLRTPITALSWSLEALIKKDFGELTEQQEQIIIDANKTTTDIKNTVELLLNASQLEEGRFNFQFEDANIESIIEEVLVKYEQIAKIKNVNLFFYRPSTKIPKIKIDVYKIKSAIEILVDNAIKYNNSNGEVKIYLKQLTDKPFIEISIEDTGMGIPEEEISRLFTKFFRGQLVIKQHTSGIGLGLYLAKNIIKGHGGEIWVKSAINRGSVFSFTLPTDPAYLPPQ